MELYNEVEYDKLFDISVFNKSKLIIDFVLSDIYKERCSRIPIFSYKAIYCDLCFKASYPLYKCFLIKIFRGRILYFVDIIKNDGIIYNFDTNTLIFGINSIYGLHDDISIIHSYFTTDFYECSINTLESIYHNIHNMQFNFSYNISFIIKEILYFHKAVFKNLTNFPSILFDHQRNILFYDYCKRLMYIKHNFIHFSLVENYKHLKKILTHNNIPLWLLRRCIIHSFIFKLKKLRIFWVAIKSYAIRIMFIL